MRGGVCVVVGWARGCRVCADMRGCGRGGVCVVVGFFAIQKAFRNRNALRVVKNQRENFSSATVSIGSKNKSEVRKPLKNFLQAAILSSLDFSSSLESNR